MGLRETIKEVSAGLEKELGPEKFKKVVRGIKIGAFLAGLLIIYSGGRATGFIEGERYAARTVTTSDGRNLKIRNSKMMVYAEDLNGHDWKIPVNFSSFLKYKMMTHYKNHASEYLDFVTYDDPVIKSIANDVTRDCRTDEDAAQLLLDFVHQQMYDCSIEDNGIDYVRYPLETLVDRNGDCEDLAILAAALIKARGIDVAIVHLPQLPGEDGGHLAVAVHGNFRGRSYTVKGKKYFYAEATGTQWAGRPSKGKIGELPPRYNKRKAHVYVVR